MPTTSKSFSAFCDVSSFWGVFLELGDFAVLTTLFFFAVTIILTMPESKGNISLLPILILVEDYVINITIPI